MTYWVFFLKQSNRNSEIFFASSKKKSHLSGHVMARTVQLVNLGMTETGQLIANQICEFCYDNLNEKSNRLNRT